MRCGGPTFEFPGEAAADKQPSSGTSGLQARRRAAHFALLRRTVSGYSGSAPPAVGKAVCDFRFEARIKGRRYARAQSAFTNTVSASRPSGTRWQRQCCAGSLPPYAASLRVGPSSKVVCQNESATPPLTPFLQGTASPCSSRAAIPPHLRREESRRKCSGQPGGSRSGCWSSVYSPLSRCEGHSVGTPCAGGTVPGFAGNVLPSFRE